MGGDMLYKREDGSASLHINNESVIATAGIMKLEEAVKTIDDYYEHLDTDAHNKLRALAGRLIAMVEE